MHAENEADIPRPADTRTVDDVRSPVELQVTNDAEEKDEDGIELADPTYKPRSPLKPWRPDEDEVLRAMVAKYGEDSQQWNLIAAQIPGRDNKACRKRWKLSLRPTLKKSAWTKEEDELLVKLHESYPCKWALIAKQISGRTDDACAKRYRDALDPNITYSAWTEEEDRKLLVEYKRWGGRWASVAAQLRRSALGCRNRYRLLDRKEKRKAKTESTKNALETAQSTVSDASTDPDGQSHFKATADAEDVEDDSQEDDSRSHHDAFVLGDQTAPYAFDPSQIAESSAMGSNPAYLQSHEDYIDATLEGWGDFMQHFNSADPFALSTMQGFGPTSEFPDLNIPLDLDLSTLMQPTSNGADLQFDTRILDIMQGGCGCGCGSGLECQCCDDAAAPPPFMSLSAQDFFTPFQSLTQNGSSVSYDHLPNGALNTPNLPSSIDYTSSQTSTDHAMYSAAIRPAYPPVPQTALLPADQPLLPPHPSLLTPNGVSEASLTSHHAPHGVFDTSPTVSTIPAAHVSLLASVIHADQPAEAAVPAPRTTGCRVAHNVVLEPHIQATIDMLKRQLTEAGINPAEWAASYTRWQGGAQAMQSKPGNATSCCSTNANAGGCCSSSDGPAAPGSCCSGDATASNAPCCSESVDTAATLNDKPASTSGEKPSCCGGNDAAPTSSVDNWAHSLAPSLSRRSTDERIVTPASESTGTSTPAPIPGGQGATSERGMATSMPSRRRARSPETTSDTNDASKRARKKTKKEVKKENDDAELSSHPRLSSHLDIPCLPYACGHTDCWVDSNPEGKKGLSRFGNSGALVEHWRDVHDGQDHSFDGKPYRCALEGCGRGWKSANGIQYHLQISKAHFSSALSEKTETQEHFAQQDADSTSLVAGLPEADTVFIDSSGQKRFRCLVPSCKSSYKQITGLRYHLLHGHPSVIPEQLSYLPPVLANEVAQAS